MIVRDKPGLVELMFAVRGSILPRIAASLIGLVAVSAALVAVDRLIWPLPHASATPFAVLGVALSLFLGFRNNAAYDRWWEARRLWGGLLADLRALAREAELFLPADEARALIAEAQAFAHLLRVQVRRQAPDAALRAVLTDAALLEAPNMACAQMDAMNARLARARAAGALDGYGARSLSTRLGALALGQAGIERIASTPLPYVYSLLIFRTIYAYVLLIPLALVASEGWFTPLFVALIAYVFLGLAEVTEDLAHPFSTGLNALPLEAICRLAEISLAPHLGRPAPEPLRPVAFHLP